MKALNELPIGPWAISQAFVQSCRSLCMDPESIDMVLHLFSRFVLVLGFETEPGASYTISPVSN